MDTFNFLIALLLIIIAMQFQQLWLVLGIVAVMILSTRSVLTTVLLIISTVVLFVIGAENLTAYWPAIVFGLIILGLILGVKGKPQEPEMYAPEGYGDLLGGM